MPRVLVVEKAGHIQALLRERFSADHISVDVVPFVTGALEKIKAQGYDVLIWDAASSKTEQSKGLELLDLLTKNSNKTYIIVLADQEGGPFRLIALRPMPIGLLPGLLMKMKCARLSLRPCISKP